MRPSDGRGVEQLAARRAHNPKVAGSSPAPATNNQVLDKFRCLVFGVGKSWVVCELIDK